MANAAPAWAGKAKDCTEPELGSDAAPLISPPASNVVVGAGQLPFYSAPHFRCAMVGVFVIPKDELVSYAETDNGWASVMYTNPRTGNVVNGWVRSARLRKTGEVAPRQP